MICLLDWAEHWIPAVEVKDMVFKEVSERRSASLVEYASTQMKSF